MRWCGTDSAARGQSFLIACPRPFFPSFCLPLKLFSVGFEAVSVVPKPESREYIKNWLPGSGCEDYVVSANVTARKPLTSAAVMEVIELPESAAMACGGGACGSGMACGSGTACGSSSSMACCSDISSSSGSSSAMACGTDNNNNNNQSGGCCGGGTASVGS